MTIIDGLTGAYNKRYLLDFLERELARFERYGRPLSVVVDFDVGTHRTGADGQAAVVALARQIEAARIAMTRHVKRGGKIWIRVFPDKPITGKPLEVRQGKGKGNVEYWVCKIQPGKMLYEMEGVNESVAREAFKLAAAKLPFKTNFVVRQVM